MYLSSISIATARHNPKLHDQHDVDIEINHIIWSGASRSRVSRILSSTAMLWRGLTSVVQLLLSAGALSSAIVPRGLVHTDNRANRPAEASNRHYN